MTVLPLHRHKSPAMEEYAFDSPPVVTIGGVLTIKQLAPLYRRMLNLDISSGISAGVRFVPPHGRGTGEVEVTKNKTREHLLRVHEAVGERKMLLVGHSLGGLVATMYAYEHPETVAGVICIAGAQEGIKHNTLAMRALMRAINNPEATDMVRYDSGFMEEHRDRVENEWPSGVALHAVATAHDVLLPAPHGFGLRPNGEPSTNHLFMSHGYGLTLPGRALLRRLPENTGITSTFYPTEHLAIPLIPPVVAYVAQVRDQLALPLQQPAVFHETA